MKQKIYKIFLAVIKNLLAFLAGGILGVLAVLLLAKPLVESAITKDIGLGVIALAPAILVIYAIGFGTPLKSVTNIERCAGYADTHTHHHEPLHQ